MHSAEGLVGGGPDLHPGGVGREDGSANVVGADEGDHAALDDRDRGPGGPEVVADQGAVGWGGWGEETDQRRAARGTGRGRKEIKGLGVCVSEALGIGGG